MDTLKLKTAMKGVSLKLLVGDPGLLLYGLWEFGVGLAEALGGMRLHEWRRGRVFPLECSFKASSARKASLLTDPAKALSQRLSEANSSNTRRARAFCSFLGNFEAFVNACFNKCVITQIV